jgi:hypothetical protein
LLNRNQVYTDVYHLRNLVGCEEEGRNESKNQSFWSSMRTEIVLTKIIYPCRNETIHLVGSKDLHDPRGWENPFAKEEKQ